MYSLEQRIAIGEVLKARSSQAFTATTRLCAAINTELGIGLDPATVGRVLAGGRYDYEKHRRGAHAHKQDFAISVLAKFFNVDLSAHRATFAQSPELYFPESPAFRPYQKSWILDCFDVAALGGLLGTCRKARRGGRTDGHDGKRIPIIERALRQARGNKIAEKATSAPPMITLFEAAAQADRSMAVPDVPAAVPGVSIDAHRAVLKQLATLGLPTAEVKAAMVKQLTDMLES